MLTQLRLSGILSRARALVFEMRGCDEPSGTLTAREVIARLTVGFPRPVLFGFPSGHTSGPCWTPFGVDVRVESAPRPCVVIEEPAVARSTTTLHPIGVCGTAMAMLARCSEPATVGRSAGVSAMSDFLVAEGITTFSGILGGEHRQRHRSRRGGERHLAW